jgi:glyoxylase-like metal-dependent hydrolase (beta-lactamase superfamily II)
MDSSGYTGHVEPGGPALRRTVAAGAGEVEITKLSVSAMDNNVYLLRDPSTGRGLLIDAADEPQRILAELGDTTLDAIVTTHGHWDHHRALVAVAEATGATVIHHPADEHAMPRSADTPADDGLRVQFGAAEVVLLHTPGHTPGSICVLLDGLHLFSGDTLFPGGPGKTTTPDEFGTVMESLDTAVFGTLSDDTWVYPGHGDDTTLGAERPHVPEWRARGW